MDCLERIRYLLKERGWSVYRLAQEAGVPQSTLANLFCETTCPPSPRWSGFARPWASPWGIFRRGAYPALPGGTDRPAAGRVGKAFPQPEAAGAGAGPPAFQVLKGLEQIFLKSRLTSACKIWYTSVRYGGIAQLVRAPASHVGGHRFEACCPHHRMIWRQAIRMIG